MAKRKRKNKAKSTSRVRRAKPVRPERPPSADKGRRSLLTMGALYIADKATGGVIGDTAVSLLSKLATPVHTVPVHTVFETSRAIGVSEAIKVAESVVVSIQGHAPRVVASDLSGDKPDSAPGTSLRRNAGTSTGETG
jgi:hypothetical protein